MILSLIFNMHSRLHVSPIQNPKLKTYVEIIISENQTQAWKTPHFLHKVTARREEPGLPEEVGAAGPVCPSKPAPSPGDLRPSSGPKARAHGSSVVTFDGHTPFRKTSAVSEQGTTSYQKKKGFAFLKKYLSIKKKQRGASSKGCSCSRSPQAVGVRPAPSPGHRLTRDSSHRPSSSPQGVVSDQTRDDSLEAKGARRAVWEACSALSERGTANGLGPRHEPASAPHRPLSSGTAVPRSGAAQPRPLHKAARPSSARLPRAWQEATA